MSLSSPTLRRFVRRALVEATGTPVPDSPQLAAAFDRLCGHLHLQLQPLFGKTAVDALFARALHVTASEFPWIRDLMQRGQAPCVANALTTVPPPGAPPPDEYATRMDRFPSGSYATRMFAGGDVFVDPNV